MTYHYGYSQHWNHSIQASQENCSRKSCFGWKKAKHEHEAAVKAAEAAGEQPPPSPPTVNKPKAGRPPKKRKSTAEAIKPPARGKPSTSRRVIHVPQRIIRSSYRSRPYRSLSARTRDIYVAVPATPTKKGPTQSYSKVQRNRLLNALSVKQARAHHYQKLWILPYVTYTWWK